MAVVQSVLILGSDSWVVTPNIMRFLGSLHNWVAQWTSGQMPWFRNGLWEYPPIGEALAEAGMEPIGECMSCQNTSVAQFITIRSIFDIRVTEERRLVSPVTM